MIAYGHYGRPLLVFPSQQGPALGVRGARDGRRGRAADRGGPGEGLRRRLLRLGQLVPRRTLPLEERAQLHGLYEDWIVNQVVPLIHDDSRRRAEIMVTGVCFGAYHAANFALRRADLFPLAICLSGVYDVRVVGWGERGDARLLQQPGGLRLAPRRRPPRLAARPASTCCSSRPGPVGGHDGRARQHAAVRAACSPRRGSGTSSTSGARTSPHDWPAWRAQIAHHLPRFV